MEDKGLQGEEHFHGPLHIDKLLQVQPKTLQVERRDNFNSGNGGQCGKRVVLEGRNKDRLSITLITFKFDVEFNGSGGGFGVG